MTSRAIHPKTNCSVIGCHRTSRRFSGEWLCGDHWKLVDRPLKRFRTRRLREAQLVYDRYNGRMKAAQARGGPEDEIWKWGAKAAWALSRWWRLEAAAWRRMKRQAIERAAGI